LAPLAGVLASEGGGLRVLYVTPLRAVARDLELALREPVEFLGASVRVEGRTGDTSSSVRQRQKAALPEVLITTPESLALLLSQPDPQASLGGIAAIVLDEWHELLGSKRGSLLELTLARLRALAPGARTWALSATLGNLDEAARAAVGGGREPCVIEAQLSRPVEVETLLPASLDDLPWTGHTGLHLLPRVVAELRARRASTLLFTTTRTQAERWYQALSAAMPEAHETLALHHGSLDRRERERVEAGLKSGAIEVVVATSTLDLGVDFGPVDRVMQLGSPRGVGRLLQRAGRASHRPGASCHLTLLPTHALELLDLDALRHALGRGEVEARAPIAAPFDVLLQHIITCALGGGFEADALYDEVRSAWSFRGLSRVDFDSVLALGTDGGPALRAYPDFRKLQRGDDGRWRLDDERLARLHRWGIGTIVGDSGVRVKFVRGADLGVLDEAFVSRLKPGDRFHFAGRTLRLVRVRDLEAEVALAKGSATTVPSWSGTRLPPSALLARELRATWQRAGDGVLDSAEARLAAPLLALQ
ncbi:MAG: DEAD/DEAH box helicase, partial [Myxococcales bacterium]